MTSFAEELLTAGASVPAVLHEFLLQHDPKEERIHAFCEGYEDPAFYRRRVENHAGRRRVFFYRCHGKSKLFALLDEITGRIGDYRHTLWFVDKDLSDVVPEHYPKDRRIYVTEYYSIENYVVCESAVRHICSDFLTLKNFTFPKQNVVQRFAEELGRFQRLVTPIMAWAICVRRNGHQVALQNLNLKELFTIDSDLRVHRRRGTLTYLTTKTGTPNTPQLWSDLKPVIRFLRLLDPKTYVRGKFELWFLLQFIRSAIQQIQHAATTAHGSLEVTVRVEASNIIALLAPIVPLPTSLDGFLAAHLGEMSNPPGA